MVYMTPPPCLSAKALIAISADREGVVPSDRADIFIIHVIGMMSTVITGSNM